MGAYLSLSGRIETERVLHAMAQQLTGKKASLLPLNKQALQRGAELVQGTKLKIFRGNEFTTNQGDILVFGYEADIKELLTIEELREEVMEAGGFMIAAHPFRGFKTFGIGQLQMTVEQACSRKVFDFVDAVEIRNGKLSAEENDMAGVVDGLA